MASKWLTLKDYNLSWNSTKPIPWNLKNRFRLILSISCLLINAFQLVDIIYRYFNSSDQPTPSDFYAPLLNIASFVS
uniref:Uncharacterized protein n=1 Tax=Tetranychus urticae TaxID=32264 RepID=T1L493_TETUR